MISWIFGLAFGATIILLNPHKLNFFEVIVICSLMAIFLEVYSIGNRLRNRNR